MDLQALEVFSTISGTNFGFSMYFLSFFSIASGMLSYICVHMHVWDSACVHCTCTCTCSQLDINHKLSTIKCFLLFLCWTLLYSIILFMRLVSPSRVLALAQSGRTLNRIQIASITVPTSSGGLLNTRISAISLLSKASRAYIQSLNCKFETQSHIVVT